MKKLLIVTIGLIFISGLVFAQISKNAETEFNLAEEVLAKQAEVIMDFVLVASGAPDRKLSNNELHTLDSMIDNFFSVRKNLFKDVKDISFLSLIKEEYHSKFLFVFDCHEVLDAYFSGFTEEDDVAQTLKRFFEKHTGYQIDIGKKNFWGLRIFLFLFLGICAGILSGTIVSSLSESDVSGLISGIIVFIAIGILFLFVFR